MSLSEKLASVEKWDEGCPVIEGPSVVGASIGKPFFYQIPVTGERPLNFIFEGLPEGVRGNSATGMISGILADEGTHVIRIMARNCQGGSQSELSLKSGCGLALTPPMGWNSWNAWRRWVNDGLIRNMADSIISTGLAAHGYQYVNIDSCWQGKRGGKYHAIIPNRKFPNMSVLSQKIHLMGLKIGIYSTPWTSPWGCSEQNAIEEWQGCRLTGCSSGPPDPAYEVNSLEEGRYIGVEKHEAEDVAQWVEWEMDFLKYDWTSCDPVSLERMGKEIAKAKREMVTSICTGAKLEHAEQYKKWAQMWRGVADTKDTWDSLTENAFAVLDNKYGDWRKHIGPGNWYDLDMLALGPQFDTAEKCRPCCLSQDEQILNMTAWILLPSPLFLSCDISCLSDFEIRLFCNNEALAINQDIMGEPARSIPDVAPNQRVWIRNLSNGDIAVGLFNLSESSVLMSLGREELGCHKKYSVRDVWMKRDLGVFPGSAEYEVSSHGARLIRFH